MMSLDLKYITIPLDRAGFEQADLLASEQATVEQGKRVYLNTLAVWAVHTYLGWVGIESEPFLGDSRLGGARGRTVGMSPGAAGGGGVHHSPGGQLRWCHADLPGPSHRLRRRPVPRISGIGRSHRFPRTFPSGLPAPGAARHLPRRPAAPGCPDQCPAPHQPVESVVRGDI